MTDVIKNILGKPDQAIVRKGPFKIIFYKSRLGEIDYIIEHDRKGQIQGESRIFNTFIAAKNAALRDIREWEEEFG